MIGKMSWKRSFPLYFLSALSLSVSIGHTEAQEAATFYKGKVVQAIVGYPAGSTFETYLRMFVRHVGKHIPGNPTVIIQQMPCLLYTSPSPRDRTRSRMPSSA